MNIHYQFIVILGCQRSGTTLTGQVLGNHSNTFLIDENDGDGMCEWFKKWIKSPDLNDQSFIDVQKKASKKYITQEKKVNNNPLSTSFSIILKAPNLTLLPNIFKTLTPKPIIIYPVRDVRSVVSSMINLNKTIMINRQSELLLQNDYMCLNHPKEISMLQSENTALHEKAAIVWLLKTKMYDVFNKHNLNPFLFKYEELIQNKSSVLSNLNEHCKLKNENNMLSYHLSMTGKGPGKTLRERKIDKLSLKKWKKSLTQKQIEDVMNISYEQMNYLGYN